MEALDAFALAVEAGSHRAVNMVLLGVLSKHLRLHRKTGPIPLRFAFRPERWKQI